MGSRRHDWCQTNVPNFADAVGLIGGRFGRRRKPRPSIGPINLPTAADIQFASLVLMPLSSYLGGRAGNSSTVNAPANIGSVNINCPAAKCAEDARAVGKAVAAGMSHQARSLGDQYRRGSSRRSG